MTDHEAIEALKEREERSKGCVWCNEELPEAYQFISLRGVRDRLEKFNTIAGIPLRYCPACGRPLKGE